MTTTFIRNIIELARAKKSWLYDIVLFIAAATLYAPSLGYGFVGDDLIYFIGNPYIESFDVLTILGSGAIGLDYLPLRDLSFALDYLLWGGNPFGFHLTNLLLFGMTVVVAKHLFLALSVFLTGQESEKLESRAFLAALVFALHPNHREVVYAVYNRGALLTVFFSGLSCLLFIRFLRGRGGRYIPYAASFFCYLFALMSREYSLILPMALVLLIFFDDSTRRETALIQTVPFFLTAAIFYGIYKEYAVAADFIMPSSEPFLSGIISKTAVAAKIALFYLVRMVTSLGTFVFDDTLPSALVSTAIVAGLLYTAYRVRHRYPQLLFGMLFYVICLIPVLNFFNTLPIVSPRYSFLPCLGLFFVIMALPYGGAKRFFPVLCVLFTISWSLLTMNKTYYWKDNTSFWELMAARDQTASAYMQLGYAYSDEGKFANALEALRKVSPPPMDPRYHAALGNTCFTLGDYPCAVTSLEAAIALGANDASVTLGLERAYMKLQEQAREEQCFDPGK